MKKRTFFVALGLVISLCAMYAEEANCDNTPWIESVDPITAHSATILIHPGNDTQTTFGLIYHKANDNSPAAYRKDTIYSNVVTLTALEANSTYEIDVRAICDENNSSPRSDGHSFTTLEEEGEQPEPCSKAPYIKEFQNITHNSVVVVLEPGVDTQTQWVLFYHIEGDWTEGAFRKDTFTTTSCLLKNLGPRITYEIDAGAICDDGEISPRSNGRPFTTREAPEGYQGLSEATKNAVPAVKHMEKGQLLIERNQSTFNVQGAAIK